MLGHWWFGLCAGKGQGWWSGSVRCPNDAPITGGIRCPQDSSPSWGGVLDAPMTSPIMGLQPITVNQLQILISTHLHWFLKILGISMIFRGVA